MTNYSTYVDWRRTFHQYPELSDEEYETTEKLRKYSKVMVYVYWRYL